MHSTEAMDFFKKQMSRAQNGLAVGQSSGNYQLFALNTRQLFKTQLMQGLIAWRQGAEAAQLIASAVGKLEANADVLAGMPGIELSSIDLPFEKAAIVSFLLDRPTRLSSPLVDVIAPDRRLDATMVSELAGGSPGDGAHSELVSLAKISDLAARSYETYFELLGPSVEGHSVDEMVREAEINFKSRISDSFYSGGDQTEGGSQDNGLVVDYRLAAVLKKIGYEGDTIHRWHG